MASTTRKWLSHLKFPSPRVLAMLAAPLEERVRAMNDNDLNRFRRSADRRSTAPPGPRRRGPFRTYELRNREVKRRFSPNMDVADRKAAKEEYEASHREVSRRISAMSDPILREHRSRLSKTYGTDDGYDDDPENGDWSRFMIVNDLDRREDQKRLEQITATIQKEKDELAEFSE
jgi:hypothetical protein